MIVDDNLMNLVLLERILKNEHYEVISISDPKQVIRTAEKQPPDLILLDVSMPDIDGFEAHSLARGTVTPEFPLVGSFQCEGSDNLITLSD